jgi:AcrR family transcriptional regulator
VPRLSADLLAQRRQHILTSAWSCFARTGFHATSMDDVVAATGMSTSAVYRYFSSKDELIDATMDEALTLVRDLFGKLLTSEPVPTPHETLRALTDELHRRSAHPRYDLSQIVIQGWTEALRRPALRERTRTFYLEAREHLAELARRWIADRQIAADADPDAVSAVLLALMPGLIVTHQLVAEFSADTLSSGLAALGSSSRRATPDDPIS